ncbi:HNH endonuclease [Mycobacterium phage Paola]|uniref:HNH endonuclease n=2 Tax=Kratiovirus TaxID=2948788 RepID=A0A2R4APQ3_9CAUD|nr:HNH endonuclease [Mycobacterium phage Leston]YP_009950899.1 HNH endonuclease [Mycobacterium phage Paola]AOQ28952.1 hypothetical protein SEA_WATERFOUL_95 [Mycobacterium phage Waterfoul]ASR85883.1 HNH endonuclease [Mycobacterium phage Guillsminger]AVO25879.1 HNH endonuclease [Mycobacterium phage Paola]AVR77057.1 HNH endonuclease [Mycobacterium phage Leston]
MTVTRSTARRDRFRRQIKRGANGNPPRPDCHRCGEPIDYEAHHLDPHSFQIDHITPLSRGGTDTLDNVAACHRKCNRDKGDKLEAELSGSVTFITSREWKP